MERTAANQRFGQFSHLGIVFQRLRGLIQRLLIQSRVRSLLLPQPVIGDQPRDLRMPIALRVPDDLVVIGNQCLRGFPNRIFPLLDRLFDFFFLLLDQLFDLLFLLFDRLLDLLFLLLDRLLDLLFLLLYRLLIFLFLLLGYPAGLLKTGIDKVRQLVHMLHSSIVRLYVGSLQPFHQLLHRPVPGELLRPAAELFGREGLLVVLSQRQRPRQRHRRVVLRHGLALPEVLQKRAALLVQAFFLQAHGTLRACEPVIVERHRIPAAPHRVEAVDQRPDRWVVRGVRYGGGKGAQRQIHALQGGRTLPPALASLGERLSRQQHRGAALRGGGRVRRLNKAFNRPHQLPPLLGLRGAARLGLHGFQHLRRVLLRLFQIVGVLEGEGRVHLVPRLADPLCVSPPEHLHGPLVAQVQFVDGVIPVKLLHVHVGLCAPAQTLAEDHVGIVVFLIVAPHKDLPAVFIDRSILLSVVLVQNLLIVLVVEGAPPHIAGGLFLFVFIDDPAVQIAPKVFPVGVVLHVLRRIQAQLVQKDLGAHLIYLRSLLRLAVQPAGFFPDARLFERGGILLQQIGVK